MKKPNSAAMLAAEIAEWGRIHLHRMDVLGRTPNWVAVHPNLRSLKCDGDGCYKLKLENHREAQR